MKQRRINVILTIAALALTTSLIALPWASATAVRPMQAANAQNVELVGQVGRAGPPTFTATWTPTSAAAGTAMWRPMSGATDTAPPPTLTAVSPTEAYNFQARTITITGTNFVATPAVRLNNVPLINATFVNANVLTATVPADLPGGVYTMTVTNPDGQGASLAGAFAVLRSGDGTLGPWQTTAAMTTLRAYHATVVAGGYLYVLGGTTDINTGLIRNSVERAAINTDGTLGPWQALLSMTTARRNFAAVAVGDYLYALGGCCPLNSLAMASVEMARINADGTLGAWQTTTSMTTPRHFLAAVAANGYLYAVGGSESNTVERAAINSDGSLGSWQATTAMNTARHCPGAVAVNGYLYAIGGSDNTRPVNSVERAAINSDGSLSAWQTMSAMTTRRANHGTVEIGGYVYALGGNYYNALSSTERAAINSDGSLSPWQSVSSMITGRRNLTAVAAGGYLYALGGWDGNDIFFSSVERSAISPVSVGSVFPPVVPSDHPTGITITGTNFLPTPSVRLGDATDLTVGFVSTSTLTAAVPAGMASGWYTTTLTNPNGVIASRTNALLVDGTAPTGSITINGGAIYAASHSATLTLPATDVDSGVAEMAFSDDGTNSTTMVSGYAKFPQSSLAMR